MTARRRVALTLLALVVLVGATACRPPGSNGNLHVSALTPITSECWVDVGIGDQLRNMLAAAAFDGVALAPEGYYSHDPIPVSGCYRSYDEQVIARNYFCSIGSCGTAAVPGTSVHGWGRAVDFRDAQGELTFSSLGYQWLVVRGGQFGFFHPAWAQPGGRNPEPWHWEA